MNIFNMRASTSSPISQALINKKKRKVPEPLITIRQIEEKDVDEVKQLLHDHFNSLTFPAVVYWSIQHIYDLLVIIVINYIFFLDLKKILYFVIIFMIYLYIRAKLEFLRHIRKDCPDLKNLYESYIMVDGCNFWVAEVFDNNFDSVSRTTCSDIHERDRISYEQDREEQIKLLNNESEEKENMSGQEVDAHSKTEMGDHEDIEETVNRSEAFVHKLDFMNENEEEHKVNETNNHYEDILHKEKENQDMNSNDDNEKYIINEMDEKNTEKDEKDLQNKSTIDFNEDRKYDLNTKCKNMYNEGNNKKSPKNEEEDIFEKEREKYDENENERKKEYECNKKEDTFYTLKDCNNKEIHISNDEGASLEPDTCKQNNENAQTNSSTNSANTTKAKDDDDVNSRYLSRKIVGCVGIVPYKGDNTIAQLVRMVVKKDNRRMRIGSRLLTQLENFAHERNYKELKVFTNNLNTDSLYFVKQNGFNLSQIVRRGLMRGDLLIWSKILNKEEFSKFNSLDALQRNTTNILD